MVRTALSVFALSLALVSCTQGGSSKNVDLKTDEQKLSYVIGQQIGNGLKSQGIQVDVDVLATSIHDVISGTPSKLTPQQMQQVMMAMQQKMMSKQMGEAKENKEKGTKFLDDNKKNPKVKVTKSGLQYEIEKEGKGATPKATDTVKVNYRGTLIDGTEFDSSYKRNQPAQFPVNGVIKGWTEALEMMKVGSKWKLFVPPEIAYGQQGRPGIPPNSVLIFEVELLDVVKKK